MLVIQMIDDLDPRLFLAIGFILLILGWILPVLMIVQVIQSTLFLDFLSYVFSFIGLSSGVIGSITYVAKHRRK
jgi:hypothetical protein